MSARRQDIFAGVYESLALRCRTIGVPLWRFDAAGAITETPELPEALSRWLNSTAIRVRLEMAARLALSTKKAEQIDLFAGAHFLPFEEREGASRVGLTAAMIFTDRVFKADELLDECHDARLSVTDVLARSSRP